MKVESIKSWLDENGQDKFLDDVKESVSISSVADIDLTNVDAPYGEGVKAARDHILSICNRFGFKTKICDNMTAWAEIGEGSPLVGILAHVDTVPVMDDWTKEQGTIEDGKFYGRGVNDDKGPMISSIYAMKRLMDEGNFKGRVRLIIGQCEETGYWPDMEYYVQTEELPEMGFTPDADFPCIYAEKGITTLKFNSELSSNAIISIEGGSASNVVPALCKAVLNINGENIELSADGTPSHAAFPELGKNAISILMEEIYDVLHKSDIIEPFVEFYHEHIGTEFNAERMGYTYSDEFSGKPSFNVGLISAKDGCVVMTVDSRYPVTGSFDELLPAYTASAESYGIDVDVQMHMKPVFKDPKSPLIQKLMSAYRDVTGDMEHEAEVTPGGTYARAMDNIIAYGALMPGRELTEHKADEYVFIEDLYTSREVFYRAIKSLLSQE